MIDDPPVASRSHPVLDALASILLIALFDRARSRDRICRLLANALRDSRESCAGARHSEKRAMADEPPKPTSKNEQIARLVLAEALTAEGNLGGREIVSVLLRENAIKDGV